MTRCTIVTVLTAVGTMFCIDDIEAKQNSISVHSSRDATELEAMVLNCSAEGEVSSLSEFADTALA